jgi:NADPH-dependent glutamate synthase beta subunit-like oxidoreductase/ferredoxin
MLKLKINNNEVEVNEGSTILEAARSLGITIPTMCHLEGGEKFTSCMVCLVKDAKNGRLMPSCSMPAMEGMDIVTNDDECREARKAALELLLSEHVGDCEAPCQGLCPAHMDIPRMNRLIASGEFDKAIEVVRNDIAIPAVLGRICPAPCEAGCRRKGIDGSVSICLLKGFVADENLAKEPKSKPARTATPKSKKVAIIGAGPAGLSAAYFLDIRGHNVDIYEKALKAGGAIRGINEERLPSVVLDNEIEYLLGESIKINYGYDVNKRVFDQLRNNYDAVIVANGGWQDTGEWGMTMNKSGVEVEAGTYLTSLENVFAIGNAVRASRVSIRSVAHGKELAAVLDRYFSTGLLEKDKERFNSKFGKLKEIEFDEYLKDSINESRMEPLKGKAAGFTVEEAVIEAKRCLHCDCRKTENCLLRDFSEEYGAQQKRFSFGERRMVTRKFGNQNIVFEENKCIRCGKCVQITKQEKEKFGLTFIGRGFDVKVGVPFDEKLDSALRKTAVRVIENCPTGALSFASK